MRLRVGSRCCAFTGPTLDNEDGGFAKTKYIDGIQSAILCGAGVVAFYWPGAVALRARDAALGIRRTFSRPRSHAAGLNVLLTKGVVRVHSARSLPRR
jgi:hypothetical protein